MATKFSQKRIDITEEAVQSDIVTDHLPQISYRDYEDAENGWNIIHHFTFQTPTLKGRHL